MEPVAALRRIAYLLEATQAPSYKVQAFRRAAEAVDSVGPARLAQLHRADQLQRLDGVGATTARVVAEALGGSVPGYLHHLEQTARPEPEGRAAQLRAALRGDCHGHTDWSDGASPLHEMAQAARQLGHQYWTVTDHSPRLTVAHGLDAERLARQLDVVAACNEELALFRILTGIEVDILPDGTLDQSQELLGRLDVVVASAHSQLRMDAAAMTRRLVTAVRNPHTDILGHCTGRIVVGRGRPPSTFDTHAVFDACAATGTAVEVNSRPERRDPPAELLRVAVEAGCLLAVDTDAHAPGQLEWLGFGCTLAAEAGANPERVVNAWPLHELLAWTAGHGAGGYRA